MELEPYIPQTSARSSMSSDNVKNLQTGELAQCLDHANVNAEGRWKAWYRKLGWVVITIIVGGHLSILGIMSFWVFLWFSHDSNSTWRSIMVGDHAKVIISFTAELCSRQIGFMVGVECSMIIALALERSEFLFPSVVSASAGRGGYGGGRSIGLMKKLVTKKLPAKGWNISLQSVVIIIALIETSTLAIHTVLLADINLGYIPNSSSTSQVNFGFSFQPQTYTNWANVRNLLYRDTTWERKAPFYAAFAEYSEDPVEQEGTSDTGVTLRAFLPMADAAARQTLSNYTGRTTVLDARVTCQVPVFEDFTVGYQGDTLLLAGWVRANRTTPRLGNTTMILNPNYSATPNQPSWLHDIPIPFMCAASVRTTENFGVGDQWRISLCQLIESSEEGGIAGGLVSEFKDYQSWLRSASQFNESRDFGTAYLFFNVSSGLEYVWREVFFNGTWQPTPVSGGSPVNEWLTFNFEAGLGLGSTLCYSAFDTADIPVSITTTLKRNRTEPEPQFDPSYPKYTFDEIRKQYGQKPQNGTNWTLEERGIFKLEKQSWIAGKGVQLPVEPYLRQFVNLAGPNADGNNPNWAGILWDGLTTIGTTYENGFNTTYYYELPVQFQQANILSPDPMHSWFFQEIVASGRSVAFALQSLITLLSSMAYYDQIAQFDNSAPVSQSFYVETNLPTQHWGWLSVTVLLVIHVAVSWWVLWWFLTETRYTILGQNWQHLAQSSTYETRSYITIAAEKNDDEVKAEMPEEDRKARVRLGPYGENGEIGIFMVENEDSRRRREKAFQNSMVLNEIPEWRPQSQFRISKST